MALNPSRFKELALNHPKPAGITFSYGTAGFRMKSELLDSIMFRVGIIAALRSRYLNGKSIGVMVTASHNPAQDNGVKIVDPYGEMLEQSWESYVTKLANIENELELFKAVEEISQNFNLNHSQPAKVIFGRDTRPSGPALIEALKHGLEALNAEWQDFELKTTPQLHYIVRCLNTQGTLQAYGEPTEEGYYKKIATAFKTLTKNKSLPPLIVDCANGVGAPKLKLLSNEIGDDIKFIIVNDAIHIAEKLNFESGADFVKTGQTFPGGIQPDINARYCALDGDADRIVFFYADPKTQEFRLLDGDKIAGLSAMFLIDLVQKAGLSKLTVGVVQTAYANGSSTNYIKNDLKIPVTCAKTGVKHLHHEAEQYDIGVYFEANGHGTILFSPNALQEIEQATKAQPQNEDFTRLSAIVDLINQTVGDALSDMLLVEVILANKKWNFLDWDSAYTDLPNRLAKVIVKDRTIFETTDAERKLTSPEGLQSKIDDLVSQYHLGRSFVRPSGTEDVVRVYAEAATRKECDELSAAVANLVQQEAGGK